MKFLLNIREFICCLLVIGIPLSRAVEVPQKLVALDLAKSRKKIFEQQMQLNNITKKINGLEVKLSLENQRYLQINKSKKELELQILDLEKNVEQSGLLYQDELAKTKNIIKNILLTKMDENENASDLLKRKILLNQFQERLLELKKQEAVSQNLRKGLDEAQIKLQNHQKLEKEVSSILQNLEAEKGGLAQEYIQRGQEKLQLEGEYNKIKQSALAEQSSIQRSVAITSSAVVAGDYVYPIPQFDYYESKNNKGVSFSFRGKRQMIAPKKGTVVYTGPLSTFGNVLMIDHHNGLKSVLLGKGLFSVKKGDTVEQGQVIGESSNSADEICKIYYELRKDNVVQNTFAMLSSSQKARSL